MTSSGLLVRLRSSNSQAISETSRQQRRHVLDYITRTVEAHFRYEPRPALIPGV